MGRYGKMPDAQDGFSYNKIANIETTIDAKQRLLNQRSVDSGPQHIHAYVQPQEGETLEVYIRRTGPYIEMLQETSIQTHINGSKMFYCHKRTDQPCFMCEQNVLMIQQWTIMAEIVSCLPKNVKLSWKSGILTNK